MKDGFHIGLAFGGGHVPDRKYVTEGCLNMFCPAPVLVQHHNLESPDFLEKAEEYPFHIYMICRRPRITFDRAAMVFGDEFTTGKFVVHNRGERIDVPFTTPTSFKPPDRDIVCDYPFNVLWFVDAEGERITGMHPSILLRELREDLDEPSHVYHLDLEVLYVGQAYGTDGNRTAPERLKSHETLLSIYSALAAKSPDDEIWLCMLSFEPPWLIMEFDGTAKVTETTLEEDATHARAMMSDPVSERQRICFAEAALIRYFQPEYNVTFKNVFPSPAHESYKECYDVDLAAVSVELTFEDLPLRMYSKEKKPRYRHFATFDLHSRELRRSMFDGVL